MIAENPEADLPKKGVSHGEELDVEPLQKELTQYEKNCNTLHFRAYAWFMDTANLIEFRRHQRGLGWRPCWRSRALRWLGDVVKPAWVREQDRDALALFEILRDMNERNEK